MVAGRDIYRVCIPLTAGVFSAALLFKMTAYGTGWHLALSLAAAYAAFGTGILALQSRESPVRSPLVWCAVFFILGFFCSTTREAILPVVEQRAFFAGLYGKLSSLIDSLPFSNRENNALVKALILADRGSLSKETTMAFRNAGAAHLLALSGMHLGIIYLIIKKSLFFLGNSITARNARGAIVIVLTGLYTLLCGSGASLMRAWLFILIGEGGRLIGRSQPPQQVLCTALTVHLILRSENIMSIGFQLSYLAMVGIVFVWPHVRWWMKGKIWAGLSLSICCQLFTAPLTLICFGTFPKYFLITNLLAAPLMSIVMLCSIAAIAIYASAPGLMDAAWLCTSLEMPLTALRRLLGSIAGLP